MFLCVIITFIYVYVIKLKCKHFTDWLTQNVNYSGVGYLLSCVICVWKWHENSIFKQYTNHLFLFVSTYYIFVHTVTLLPLTMCLALGNVDISISTTFTTVVIFGQISKGPMNHFLCVKNVRDGWTRPVESKCKIVASYNAVQVQYTRVWSSFKLMGIVIRFYAPLLLTGEHTFSLWCRCGVYGYICARNLTSAVFPVT